MIELDEGVRMMSRVEGLPPTDVTIGLRVTARLVDQGETKQVIFEPSGGPQ